MILQNKQIQQNKSKHDEEEIQRKSKIKYTHALGEFTRGFVIVLKVANGPREQIRFQCFLKETYKYRLMNERLLKLQARGKMMKDKRESLGANWGYAGDLLGAKKPHQKKEEKQKEHQYGD